MKALTELTMPTQAWRDNGTAPIISKTLDKTFRTCALA